MMAKALVRTNKVEFISGDSAQLCKDVYFNLPLLSVAGKILEDLQCNNFVSVFLPAADYLTERASSCKEIEGGREREREMKRWRWRGGDKKCINR